jgi:asparagine synthase (glutamine-hydrolysing)
MGSSVRYRATCWAFEEPLLGTLKKVVARSRCDCATLSGIDSTLAVAVAKSLGLSPRCYTVVFTGGLPRDLMYAEYVSKWLNLELRYVLIDEGYLRRTLDALLRCVGETAHELCVELRNDVVFYAALSEAKRDGCRCVLLGSGGDEVFAGYRFMLELPDEALEERRDRYARSGRYPELLVARCLGVNVVAPYLSQEVLEVALRIPASCLRGSGEGKTVLRELLARLGLEPVARRAKVPAEGGAGTDSVCLAP